MILTQLVCMMDLLISIFKYIQGEYKWGLANFSQNLSLLIFHKASKQSKPYL